MYSLWKQAAVAVVTAGALLIPVTSRGETDDPFAGATQLDRAVLVREVVARNPDIGAARAAWSAAEQRIPQVTALSDPTVSVGVAPFSFGGHGAAHPGVTVGIEQMIPFPGKLSLKGDMAAAEAAAMRGDLDAMKLELALMASSMFDDWYVVHRALEVNAHHLEAMRQLKRSASAQYAVGRATQGDPLQAEVELARMERERLMLESEQQQLQAKMNALLHLLPGSVIPPPPPKLETSAKELPGMAELQAEAIRLRPELATARARLTGAEAGVAMAKREYLPDFGVMAEYDSMWPDPMHRFMAGVMVEVPIQLGRRKAAVEEARAQQTRMQHEEESRLNRIRAEVAQMRARVEEAQRILALYDSRLIPAARNRLTAARAAFETGGGNFMALVDAENELREMELQQHVADADVRRRLAELDRAVGRVPGLPQEELP
ncbi:MAG: TolC family protein [Myxococcaceae bacterium]